MSTQYKHFGTVPSDVLAKRLDELSDSVAKRGEERDRELTRRIPAELDRDADLVLAQAAKRLRELEAREQALAAHVERWRVAYMKLTNAELTEDADTREVMHLATGSLMSEFDAIAEQTPATSLARRDADILESWAGRLEELADNARENDCPEHSEGMQDAAEETQQEALRIRRQAGVIE